jgi:flagellar biosynthetic protein FliO
VPTAPGQQPSDVVSEPPDLELPDLEAAINGSAEEGGDEVLFEQTQPPEMSYRNLEELAGEPGPPAEAAEQPSGLDMSEVGSRMRQTDEREGEVPATPDGVDLNFYLQALAALLFVLALIAALSYLARRFGKRTALLRGMQLGEVLGRVYLSQRASVHFVRVGDRVLLLGVTPQQVTPLGDYPSGLFEEGEQAEAGDDESGETSGSAAPAPSKKGARKTSSGDFLRVLKEEQRSGEPAAKEGSEDDAMEALRGDIQRLRDYLREQSKGE